MKIDNVAWYTLYDDSFSKDKYLYHFTTMNKGTKILFGNNLKFSKLSLANDSLEAKPKLAVSDFHMNSQFADAIKHFQSVNQKFLQLLCFTKDKPKQSKIVDERLLYTDYSGRGFALPRMWAQYTENNTGVCLVFDKDKLVNLIKKEVNGALIHHGDIVYKSQFETFEFDMEKIENLLKSVKRYNSLLHQGIVETQFLRDNLDFVKYNYFSKLDDWQGENEYRFLAFGDQDFYVSNIKDALSGVIIGEKITDSDEEIVKLFCEDLCEVKKITFTYSGCRLTNIN